MKDPNERYTICVDFDGVIHSYISPWIDAKTIPDSPVAGAIEWLYTMVQHFNVAIFSTRSHQLGGKRAMKTWLKHHAGGIWHPHPAYRGLEEITFPTKKPAALIYLDDRAVRFEGTNFPTRAEIHKLRPWNKPQK